MRLIVLLFMLASLSSFAQSGGLTVAGLVYGNNGLPLKQATVSLSDSDGKTTSITTSGNGKYSFELTFDKSYELAFNKSGLASKKMIFDTRNVPDPDQGYQYEYSGFRVTLYEGDDTQEPSEIARVSFDAELSNFATEKD